MSRSLLSCLGKMWLDLPFAQVSRSVEQNMHTTFSFPNRLSQSEELKSWGCSKILLSFLMQFDGHFWPNQQHQQCLVQFKSILDGHLSRRHLPAPFCLEIENTTTKRLIGLEPHSHKPSAPNTSVSVADRLALKQNFMATLSSSVIILSMSLSYVFSPLTSPTIILCSQSVHWLGLWARSPRKIGRLIQCVLREPFLQWQSSQAMKLSVYFHEMVKLRMHSIKLPPSLTAWGQLYTFTRILSATTSSIDSEMYYQGVCDT